MPLAYSASVQNLATGFVEVQPSCRHFHGSSASLPAQGGLPDLSTTRNFAEDLLARIPRTSGQSAGASTYVQQERAKAALASRNRGYALLEASDEEEEAPVTAPAPTTTAIPKAAKQKHIRKSKVRSRLMPAKTSTGHARLLSPALNGNCCRSVLEAR